MQATNYLGIDVGAEALVVCIDRGPRRYPVATFDNNAAGHRKLISWATKRGKHARVCLEATGVYSLLLALALDRHPKTEVMVVNPRASRNFAQAMMKRAKTDPIDAEVLVEFVHRMPFEPWQPPSPQVLQLQALTRRIYQLKKALQSEKNRRHAADYRPELDHLVIQDLAVNIRHLERRITRLEQQARQLVAQEPDLERKLQRLISAKGIADSSAVTLLAELLVLPADLQPEQWVAQAGLDPRPRESGNSVYRPRYISKAGNKHLRAALYFPAMVASQFDPHVVAFRDKLIAPGKKPMQAIVAVMRKLLRCIWAMLKYDQDFDGEKFYALAGKTA